MEIDRKGTSIIVKDTLLDLTLFITKLTNEYKSYADFNLIVNVSNYNSLTVKQIEGFLPLSKIHKKAKKSFVILSSESDYNSVSEKLAVVRSLQEAFDLIEMEEIERDLGF